MPNPKPANSTGMHAPPSSPCIEGMRRPRPPAEEDDNVVTVKRSYLPADALEQDAAQPLLSASGQWSPSTTAPTRNSAPAADVEWQQVLNEVLAHAIETRDHPAVMLMLNRGADVNFVDPLTADTPLLLAMDNLDAGMTELLLASGADPNLVDPISGNTPLMVALFEQNPRAAGLLVAYGADEDLANPRNGQTAWLIAQRHGYGQELGTLLAQRQSCEEQSDSDSGPQPLPVRADRQDNALDLPGAVNGCDIDGTDTCHILQETYADVHVTVTCPAVSNDSTDTASPGHLYAYLLGALSEPWQTYPA